MDRNLRKHIHIPSHLHLPHRIHLHKRRDDDQSQQQLLPIGAKVKGDNHEYTIAKVLGKGAYGVTYLATTLVKLTGDLGTIETEAQVTLKEFYMQGRMSRTGDVVNRNLEDTETNSFARCFYLEADKIASLSHPNIVKVLEVFVANNTCYYAMEYLSGGSLTDYIEKKNGLDEAEAIDFITQIGSALAYMHEHKMLHLDVKPSNIMLSSDGKPKLIDYGLSQQYGNDGELELDDGLGSGTPGYAPLEQSGQQSVRYFSPTLDVYALGATYYKMLTGISPANAVDILNSGVNTMPLVSRNISQRSIDVIKAAMQPVVDKRLQSIEALLDMLQGTSYNDAQEYNDVKGLWMKFLAVITLLVGALVLLLFLF